MCYLKRCIKVFQDIYFDQHIQHSSRRRTTAIYTSDNQDSIAVSAPNGLLDLPSFGLIRPMQASWKHLL
jgi:hypothetical protein